MKPLIYGCTPQPQTIRHTLHSHFSRVFVLSWINDGDVCHVND